VDDEATILELLSGSLRLAGFAVGADDYVTKPFSLDELLVGQFHGQAELPGQQARALPVLGTERTGHPSEPDVVQCTAKRQAVLAHELDPLASWPGQFGGPGVGRVETAV
jgi:CheY-like chemotaxis protein